MPRPSSGRLVNGEAVEVPVAARSLEIRLPAVPTAVGCVPRGRDGATTRAVMMPDLGASFSVARPIPARMVRRAVCEPCPVELRPRENVVLVRIIAPAVDHLTLLAELRLFR